MARRKKMTKNSRTNSVIFVMFATGMLNITVRFLVGKPINLMILYLYYGISFLNVMLLMVTELIKKISKKKLYKKYTSGFEYLKQINEIRYKMYFIGKKEDVEKYSKEIERYSKTMIEVGGYFLSNYYLNQKSLDEVRKILQLTKEIQRGKRI